LERVAVVLVSTTESGRPVVIKRERECADTHKLFDFSSKPSKQVHVWIAAPALRDRPASATDGAAGGGSGAVPLIRKEATMTKLNDTQLILLSTAAARENGSLIPLPPTIADAGAKAANAIAALLKRGLAHSRFCADNVPFPPFGNSRFL
jgi:hypothetical protein